MTPDPTEAALPTGSAAGENGQPPDLLADDVIDYTDLVIEDNKPVDNLFVEHLYKLLTGTLYQGWVGPGEGRSYLAVANVGLFYQIDKPPLVPDIMLSLDVPVEIDPLRKEKNSYYVWRAGKPPDVVIEVVSDRRGGEDSTKLRDYARIGVPYYVIFDPRHCLSDELLRSYVRHGATYVSMPDHWFPTVGLGLTLWEGTFQKAFCKCWLRWCDERGQLIPMAEEIVQQERQKRERLEGKLRQLGIDPNA